MKRFLLLGMALVASSLVRAGDAPAPAPNQTKTALLSGEKDKSKAGMERKGTKDTEEPDVVEISREKFACNDEVIKIGNLKAAGWYKLNEKGFFEVKKDSESPLLAIRGKTIGWWCGAASEDLQADTGTQYIVVQRGPKGAGNVIYYKKK
ncbi:hypothetical protein [Fimbriiglobus ruber]|uniref:Uncharacterized protein n=1 Tax=Fimbriiglobus ruber TaxID=1908690 RepID=A0A225DK28_9BACT|nr:hypothetical protein [Fimbriiglobus ruber]OWK38948.1 hypothetical protein FRUB_06324 [Fimbriiglobus ruber]